MRTVLFCGPGTDQVPLALQGGSLPYRLEGVAVGIQDGAATLARLRAVAAEGGAWADTLTALFDRALSATALADL